VTGGPTREWIDPVRYISNASSGKMGVALADAAMAVSERTVFIHGPVDPGLLAGRGYRAVSVETTEDLLRAVTEELEPDCVLIMAAAPADYRPAVKAEKKIKKQSDELVIELKKNPDILKHVAELRRQNASLGGMFVVGFAAETDNVEAHAQLKLKEKNLDMICLNDVGKEGAGFAGDTNIITMFSARGGCREISMRRKSEIADIIISSIEEELALRG
ncbi:MAG TPA: phosphopantothenoylcysteine decarboxylase, partial [Spirochaetes bacterium]|nr:phosphopantothenoylcysteine decarboxylase [Spirochaetota bacterium]